MMLTQRGVTRIEKVEDTSSYIRVLIAVGFLLFAIGLSITNMVEVFRLTMSDTVTSQLAASSFEIANVAANLAHPHNYSNLQTFGYFLYTYHTVSLLLVAIILFIAMVGAIMLTIDFARKEIAVQFQLRDKLVSSKKSESKED